MKLYLLRHGKADWPDWQGDDDDRPLTGEGVKEMRLVAAALKRMKVAPEVVLSSPLPRAWRTAGIASKILAAPLKQLDELSPGFTRRHLDPILAAHDGKDLMLVGHEPDFSHLIRSLTGGRAKLPKAGVAAIELGDDLHSSRLLWLLPAKLIVRFYA